MAFKLRHFPLLSELKVHFCLCHLQLHGCGRDAHDHDGDDVLLQNDHVCDHVRAALMRLHSCSALPIQANDNEITFLCHHYYSMHHHQFQHVHDQHDGDPRGSPHHHKMNCKSEV
jgi:hypothetical protein